MTRTEQIGVVLIDDHAILREGLVALIEKQEDMRVLGQAGDGVEGLSLCRDHRPDVAIIDLTMPILGGLAAISKVCEACPDTRIVVLTMHDKPEYLRSALAAGAAGYVVKELASREILEAVRAAHLGQIFVRMSLATEDTAVESNKSTGPRTRGVPTTKLSSREKEVLGFIVLGYTNQETADALGVGKKSVDSYRARIMQKLGLSRRSELVRYAIDSGLLAQDLDH